MTEQRTTRTSLLRSIDGGELAYRLAALGAALMLIITALQ